MMLANAKNSKGGTDGGFSDDDDLMDQMFDEVYGGVEFIDGKVVPIDRTEELMAERKKVALELKEIISLMAPAGTDTRQLSKRLEKLVAKLTNEDIIKPRDR